MNGHHKIICCKNKMVYIDLIQFAKNKLSYRILYLLLIQVMISTRSSTINYKRRVILVCVVNQNLAVVIVVNKTLIILLLLLISWDLTVCVVLARHRGCVCNRRTNDLKSNWILFFTSFSNHSRIQMFFRMHTLWFISKSRVSIKNWSNLLCT